MQAALDSKPFQSIALSYHHCEYFPWPPEVAKLHPVWNAQPLLPGIEIKYRSHRLSFPQEPITSPPEEIQMDKKMAEEN